MIHKYHFPNVTEETILWLILVILSYIMGLWMGFEIWGRVG